MEDEEEVDEVGGAGVEDTALDDGSGDTVLPRRAPVPTVLPRRALVADTGGLAAALVAAEV